MSYQTRYPLLREIGLNETEHAVYEVLLEKGPQIGSTVAKNTGLARGNVYNAITSLKEKGLIEEEGGKKIATFKAADPENLRALLDAKRARVSTITEQFGVILPALKSSHRLFTKQPTIRVFEGVEGLKEIYRETLKQNETIYALVSPDEPDPKIFAWLTSNYVHMRVKKGLRVVVVANGASQASSYMERNMRELRDAKIMQSEQYPFRGEVDVFGDQVAFIAYRSDELIGVIIESPSIAETLRSSVKFMYATLPA